MEPFIVIWIGITFGIMIVALVLRAEEGSWDQPNEDKLRPLARAFLFAWTWPIVIVALVCYACYKGVRTLPTLWKEAWKHG